MLRSFAAGVTLALSLASLAPSAQAQVRERDVTITGPRGNSIKRQFESVRTPGGLTREMTITRPAGTYHRELNVTRPPSVVGGGPRGWGYPPVRNDVYIERDVIEISGGVGDSVRAAADQMDNRVTVDVEPCSREGKSGPVLIGHAQNLRIKRTRLGQVGAADGDVVERFQRHGVSINGLPP